MNELLEIMSRLRDPERGCPWDVEQDFATIAPYTIEEAYEVADAIERQDMAALRDELGDLLLQVVFHAQMAAERGEFGFSDVVDSVCDKMVRRHPHVFDQESIENAAAQTHAWERTKAKERHTKGLQSVLDDVPRGMAELQRAVKLQTRAATVGFDWPSAEPVLDKFEEETEEIREAMAGGDAEEIEDEIGDLLFVVANLARQLEIDPARALRRANAKFEARFRALERAGGGRDKLQAMTLEELESLWQAVKSGEAA